MRFSDSHCGRDEIARLNGRFRVTFEYKYSVHIITIIYNIIIAGGCASCGYLIICTYHNVHAHHVMMTTRFCDCANMTRAALLGHPGTEFP